MSDMLTHWAVFEDCRRLALLDNRVDRALAGIMHDEREFARLGALARAGEFFVPHILNLARNAPRRGNNSALLRRKLAFALGGITHYAADAIMKPLAKAKTQADWNEGHWQMQRGDGAPDSAIREVSAYYDTHVFRKGRKSPSIAFSSPITTPSPAVRWKRSCVLCSSVRCLPATPLRRTKATSTVGLTICSLVFSRST